MVDCGPPDVTVLIAVERGREPDARVPSDVAQAVVRHERGARGKALDNAVAAATTPFVMVLEPDAGIDRSSLGALCRCAWDAPAAYPTVAYCSADGKVRELCRAAPFCPHRLAETNYIGPSALVRRSDWLACGGWGAGAWDLWLRLPRLKPCRDARYWVRTVPREIRPLRARPTSLRATFYVQANAAQTYWRAQLPARYLPAAVDAGPPTLAMDGSSFTPERDGAAILAAPGDAARAVVADALQGLGVPVLVEVDDDYLRYTNAMARAGWAKSVGATSPPHSVERHRAIVASADAVIVSTDPLAERYRRVNRNVHVCPNAIEPADWPDVDKPGDGVIRIGWFASSSHERDRRLVGPALEWASRQPGVEVVTMGVGVSRAGSPWWTFPSEHIDFDDDIRRYWLQMNRLDIGLAPIAPNAWSICRSDLKALEYAMAGACPVLSDVPPYAGWRDGEGCLKAATAEEFLAQVKRLVRAPGDTRALAREARASVLAGRTVEATQHAWQDALEHAAAQRARAGSGTTTRARGIALGVTLEQ